ncbi:hypothetical protein C5B90_08805 [Haloferax sp. Atlit-12N]|uniref:hypothetical protein n=1 Tax=Haloferax sp. Atlit-12N TaxID=2077203 RepID=UPI000E2725B7|nr:hypothetical protein [Haloferax sp. Atlit-12N]RDZ63249.1 hypothetical protein C5B90_08805 [Haloferax sp. Atlit-12N]
MKRCGLLSKASYAACDCWNANATATLGGGSDGDDDGDDDGSDDGVGDSRDGSLSVESFESVCE